MNTRTVLHVVGSADLEGIGISRYALDLLPFLPERYRFQMLFLGSDGVVAERARRRGMQVRCTEWMHPLQIGGALRTWRTLRADRVDIVHQHYGGRTVKSLLHWRTQAPVIAHMCGRLQESEWRSGPRRFEMSAFDAVTAVSQAVADCALGAHARVAHPGIIAAAKPRPMPSRQICRIGAAGRMVELKGLDLLVRAFASIAPAFPMAELLLAGGGPEQPRLEHLAKELGVQERVKFLGWVEDTGAFYRDLDVLVQPSMEEAFGMSAAEAMAEGVPVIATSVGGLIEILGTEGAGQLVPAGDEHALVEALSRVLSDRELQERMGRAGWERIRKEFDPRIAAQRLVEIYDSVLQPKSRQ